MDLWRPGQPINPPQPPSVVAQIAEQTLAIAGAFIAYQEVLDASRRHLYMMYIFDLQAGLCELLSQDEQQRMNLCISKEKAERHMSEFGPMYEERLRAAMNREEGEPTIEG